MSLGNILRPSRRVEARLADRIEADAARITAAEGKDHCEAEYLAICNFIDEQRVGDAPLAGMRTLVKLMRTRYAHHRVDVMLFMAWRIGLLGLPEGTETELSRRHLWRA